MTGLKWSSPLSTPTIQSTLNPNKSPPFVSVALITYNEMSTIEQCLSSIDLQDYPRDRFEVVVVDGGSTDGTLELLEKHSVGLVVERRRGRGRARNTAMENCKGEVIIFTDADCLPSRSWLGRHVALHRDPKIMAVAGSVMHGGDRSLSARFYHRTEFSAFSNTNRRGEAREVATCNASFKPAVFSLVGPFPELNWSEDYLLSWRIRRAGLGLVFDPAVQVVHLHEAMGLRSLLGKIWQQGRYDRILQDAFGDDPAYRLPRDAWLVATMLPSLLIARLLRYTAKVLQSDSRNYELLVFPPYLIAASIAWALGYFVSSLGAR